MRFQLPPSFNRVFLLLALCFATALRCTVAQDLDALPSLDFSAFQVAPSKHLDALATPTPSPTATPSQDSVEATISSGSYALTSVAGLVDPILSLRDFGSAVRNNPVPSSPSDERTNTGAGQPPPSNSGSSSLISSRSGYDRAGDRLMPSERSKVPEFNAVPPATNSTTSYSLSGFTATQVNTNGSYFAGSFMTGGGDLQQFANGSGSPFPGNPGTAAFYQFTTSGTQGGTLRSLAVGDSFTITNYVANNTSFFSGGSIGIKFLDATSYTVPSGNDLSSNAANNVRAFVQLNASPGNYFGGGTTTASPGLGAGADRTFTITITSSNTFNLTIAGTTYYNLQMLGSPSTSNRIQSFVIYDQTSGNSNDSFWKNPSLTDTGAVILDTSSGSASISGVITDGLDSGSTSTPRINSVTKTGANTATLSGANTYTGNTFINNGTVAIATGGSLSSSSAIRLGNTTAGSGNATLALTNLTGGQSLGNIINPGYLNSSSSYLLDSQNTSGTNTLSGNIFLDANFSIQQASGGTLALTNTSLDLKAQSLTLLGSGGFINITGVIGNSTGSGQLVIGTNGNATSGATVMLSNANTYTGQTFVRNGTLGFTSSGSSNNSVIRLGSDTGTGVNANVALTTLTGGTLISSTINPVATGTGTLSLDSQNTSNSNTYSGHIGMDRSFSITQASGGTLNITQAHTDGVTNATGLDIKGFTLLLSGAGTPSKINVSGDIYNSIGSGTVTIGNNTAGAVTTTLSGNNTYAGATKIDSASVLYINSATALGTSQLQITGANTTIDNTSANAITLTNNNSMLLSGGNLTFAGTKDLSFGSGAVTLSGTTRTITTTTGTLTVGAIGSSGTTTTSFSKLGAGTLIVTGNSSYTATTSVVGTLKIDNNASTTSGKLGVTTGITVNASGTLLLSGSSSITDRISDTATMTLSGGTFNTGGLTERTGTAAGIGALTLTANSTIDFGAGANSILQFAGLGAHPAGTGPDLAITNWNGIPNAGGGTERLLFTGTTTDFTGKFDQTDVSFNGLAGYQAVQFGTFYEITAVPEPSTWIGGALAVAALGWSLLKRSRKFKV